MKTQTLIARITCPKTIAGCFTTACATRLLPLLLLFPRPAVVQAQFNYETNNGTITITAYNGSPVEAVIVPSKINGLPVTRIGDSAFRNCWSLPSATIGDNVTNIGDSAFGDCWSLTSVTIGTNLTRIGDSAFGNCWSLTSVTIPSRVTSIGAWAFYYCTSLSRVTIPNSVTNLDDGTLRDCTSLTGVYFRGNAPSLGSDVFYGDNNATVYYLPGTAGWGAALGERPTALWSLPSPVILDNGPSFGVQTNGFGFIISWATNLSVVVEACTDLANPTWSPISTNTLTNGSCHFSDPKWTYYLVRFYRIRSP